MAFEANLSPRIGPPGSALILCGLESILFAEISKIDCGFAQGLQKFYFSSRTLSTPGKSSCVFAIGSFSSIALNGQPFLFDFSRLVFADLQ